MADTYDYNADPNWMAYYASLEFVTKPTMEQLNRIKRKWYCKNVVWKVVQSQFESMHLSCDLYVLRTEPCHVFE